MLRGINRGERNWRAIAQHENACLSIGLNPGKRHSLPEMCGDGSNERGNTLATRNWDARCPHNSTTVRAGDNILGEPENQDVAVGTLLQRLRRAY
jgi:hypothetical protein